MPHSSPHRPGLRLLFVDDEPFVLQGLRRSLRSTAPEWEVDFANSAAEALDKMTQSRFDVVVTDMRMPVMDGAQLLVEVKNRHPDTVRIVLSGQSSSEALLRSIGPSHQYLSKPCDVSELKARIDGAFLLRDVLGNSAVRQTVSRLTSIPSLPALHQAIVAELSSSDPSSAKVAAIVAQDAGMTAKVLQLANSALLGLRSQISSAFQAAQLIGVEMMRSLVLSMHVFSPFEATELAGLDLVEVWKHNVIVGTIAQAVAQAEGASKQMMEDCFTAGLLHDVGRIILASAHPEIYRQVLQRIANGEGSVVDAESAAFGCSHAQVGAHLIGIWGLPTPIVEAIAWHHAPTVGRASKFNPTIATHVADALANGPLDGPLSDVKDLDMCYLETVHLADRVPNWFEISKDTISAIASKTQAKAS